MSVDGKTRLFIDADLGAGQSVNLNAKQAHYLLKVMRLSFGTKITLFNGRDGAWLAELNEGNKRGAIAVCEGQSAAQMNPPDLWLLFAPIKKARTDFIVEKAVEMGVRRIIPVQTQFTNSERIRQDRLQAHAVEAAEQCGATFVPEVAELQKLERLFSEWPTERQIMFCDEARAGEASGLPDAPGPWAILIGLEGGFSEAERTKLSAMEQAHVVALGPRILRADTAAVAALTIWQQALGDWV